MPQIPQTYWSYLGHDVYCLEALEEEIIREAFPLGSEGFCNTLHLTSYEESSIIDRNIECIRQHKQKVSGHKSATKFQFVFIVRNDGKLFVIHAVDLSREDAIDALSLTDDARALASKIATGEMA